MPNVQESTSLSMESVLNHYLGAVQGLADQSMSDNDFLDKLAVISDDYVARISMIVALGKTMVLAQDTFRTP